MEQKKINNLTISKYALKKNQENKIIEIDWQDGASEMIDVAVAKYVGSLLVGDMAVVGLMYKNGNMYEIYGPREEAMFHAVEKIKAKKKGAEEFHQKFMSEWNKAVPYAPGSLKSEITKLDENKLLGSTLKAKGYNAPKFAAEVGRTKQSIYGQISGEKGISKETAIEYAKTLNVDPVDLLFPKKTCSIWGYVNTLDFVDLEEPYSPGRIYTSNKEEQIIVPRDIASPNIRAIKIHSHGSMYHNQIVFYYKDNAAELDINNKLCIVGAKVKGFLDEELTYYFFGLYENIRGKHNLLNPDPYIDDAEKYMLKNFNLEFISPVVSTVDPKAVKDATDAKQFVPERVLISQQQHEKQMQILQQQFEKQIIELEKQKNMDLEQGKKVLAEYGKAQDDLQKKLNKVMREIEVSHYGPKSKQRSAISNVLEMTKEALSKKRA
tara:strand:- start:114 stop:1421 length:1308 start_codon:yes stop_codon:yes gene_type:complete